MKFRKEISGVLLAVCAGALATVAIGQGQGPSLGDLMVPETGSSAKATPKPDEKKIVETKPAETKPVETKTVETKKAEVTESDEINLSEIDDSAEAAKGRPVVKLAEQAPAAVPPAPVASAPIPADSSSLAQATHASATGTEIAARFLAGDETALVDITSDNASLTDILRQFRRATGANIIYAESSNLQQRVSVSLKHVPWLQGMKSILNSRGFRVESTGGIHFIKEDKQADPVFTRTFQLNHASVDELATLFNESFGVKGKDGKFAKSVATPFQGANTIVVTANEHVLADCEAIIKAVDKAVPQIYIEARFIELSSQAMHKLGVQWNQLSSWGATVHDLNAGIEYNNGRLNKFSSGTSTSFYQPKTYDAAGKDISDGHSAVDYITKNYLVSDSISNPSRLDNNETTADMAWRNARVFSGQLSADDFSLAMSAFEQLEDAKIFSNPKVIVSNGKEALFDRTTKFPHITLTSQHDTQSGYTKSDAKLEIIPGEDELFSKKRTAFFSWGITLTVKPRISPDGLISVEIVPSISDLQFDETEGGTSSGFYAIYGGSDAPYGRYPIILFKRLATEFTMKDGATAVIGGLSKTEEGDVDSGIPYLRKIPWIGPKLFGWKSRGKVQKEILIFVTVGIADPANLPEDIGLPKNAIGGREYVEKRAFEPGDRPNAANDVLKIDTRSLDKQQAERVKKAKEKKDEEASGTVTITPVTE
jgi:type II secretory pathway component GspD/PulD (secretin)